MSKFSRFFNRKYFIADKDKRKIHQIGHITDQCDISDNVDNNLTELQARNYEIYDYYTECPHCCKKHIHI